MVMLKLGLLVEQNCYQPEQLNVCNIQQHFNWGQVILVVINESSMILQCITDCH